MDRGQTSHSTSSSTVLQMVPVSLAHNLSDNQRRHSLPFSFSLYFCFHSLSLPVIHSFPFFLFFYTVALFLSPHCPPNPACLWPSLVFFFPSLRLEDTRCKHSSTQRRMPHTIFLAFKGWEYSQLCWKLNSLKPPFPPQQFIVGEFSVFGERLELSRGWCQRAPIVPCSAAVSPPLRLHSTFPSSPDIHLMTEKKVWGVGIRNVCICQHLFLQDMFNLSYFWLVYSAAQEGLDNNVSVQ